MKLHKAILAFIFSIGTAVSYSQEIGSGLGIQGPTGPTGATGNIGAIGATGQTLYYDGSNWVATSNLYNDGVNVGIGTDTPSVTLDIFGQVNVSDSTQFYGSVRMDSIVRITKGAGTGKVLTSSSNGTATWQQPASDSIVFANGLYRASDSVFLGGSIIHNTILEFNPSDISIAYGDVVDSGYVLYYGNFLGDGGRFGCVVDKGVNLVVDSGGRFAGLGVSNDDGTGNASSGVNVIQDGYGYGLYNFYNGGKRTANIYFGLNDGSGTIDISRIEANINEVHGRHIIDSTGVIPNYNGFHANADYSQLEFDKVSDDGQATGTLWVLDANGASYYVGGTVIFRIGNTIPTYADDAAAAAGGVAVNQIYKTTTGGSTFLKIRQ